MSIPRSRKAKRTWIEETARVIAIAKAIDEEARTFGVRLPGAPSVPSPFTASIILEVADRIAARTED